jgi:hypothetical protein
MQIPLTSEILINICLMRKILVGVILLFLFQLGNAQLIPGIVGSSQTICYNTAPARLTETTPPSGGTGSYTRQWQNSSDNLTWTNIPGATRSSYTVPVLTNSTYYRISYLSGSETAVSIPALITVTNEVIPGTIGTAQTICYNTAPVRLAESTLPSGGTGSYTRQWQNSSDNLTWTDIPGATRSSYTVPVLTNSTYYRLNVASGGCLANNGTPVLITVNSEVTSGNIGSAQTICYNTIPVPLNQLNSPSGGNGTYLFQWQSSADNVSWTNIDGATLAYYSPSALTTNTWFRRLVSSGTCSAQSIPSVLISVNPELTPGYIGSDQTICYNTIPVPLNQLNSPTGGTGIYTYQWQSSTDNSTWINISGASLPFYSPPALTLSTWFRRIVYSGTCSSAISSAVLITVNSNLYAGRIGSTQTICFNTAPVPLTQIEAPTGGTGLFTYQWQNSIDNINWVDIEGANSVEFSPPVLTTTTWYRRLVSSGNCGTLGSASVQIFVSPQITNAQLHDNISIIEKTSTNYYINISGGTAPFVISYTRNGVLQAPITDYSSGALISTGILSVGIYTYTLSSITDANGCTCENLGTSINVTVNEFIPTFYPVGSVFSTELPLTFESGGPYELGTEFQTLQSGYITAFRLFTSINESGEHSIRLWERVGEQYTLVAGPFLWNVTSGIEGWQEFSGLTTPIHVDANQNYIISISTSSDLYFSKNGEFFSGTQNDYVRYLRGGYTTTLGDAPTLSYSNSSYFRDIVFALPDNQNLNPGIIAASQSICFNSIPATLTHLTSPTGGTGLYTYQWQSSLNGTTWTDITDATLSSYSPPVLPSSTYYRCSVISGPYLPVQSLPVHVTVLTPVSLAQLERDTSIFNNTSTNFSINITGGAPPYNIIYTRNGIQQPPIVDYTSGSNISSGILTTGNYIYALTSVTFGSGCSAVNLGSSITIKVLPDYSIFDDAPVSYITNGTPVELGTRFTTTRHGLITKVYLFKTPSETGTHQVRLWQLSSGNYEIVSGPYNWVLSGDTEGWVEFELPTPVRVQSDTEYIVSVSTGADFSYSYIDHYFDSPVNNAFIHTFQGSGVFSTSLGAAPSETINNRGYFRDINFVPDPICNNALVLINSSSGYYQDYINYIIPYLNNFGIPYDQIDVNSSPLPELDDYAVIIFGHRNVYQNDYPITQIENAVNLGVGLYSFDPHLFDFPSDFNTPISLVSVNTNQIYFLQNTSHYITQNHIIDAYFAGASNIILRSNWSISQNSNLVGGQTLAIMSESGQDVPLLQVSQFGKGRIVKWSGYDWVFETILGPVYGMDDLIWRGIVWAARKPFVMQGLPPMITMRVDDVTGTGGGISENFEWIRICNEYGLKPWCGTFNSLIPTQYLPTLKTLIDNNLATAFPHANGGSDFIYFNHIGLEGFNVTEKVQEARNFYIQNGLQFSNYCVPHVYEYSAEALSGIRDMGGEFIATHMLPDNFYLEPTTAWLNCGPYRINRNGNPTETNPRPVYYGGNVTLNGIQFFNCLSEIRDDGTYEWYPTNDVHYTVSRGVRHLRRAFNGMFLASLFTHEQYILDFIDIPNWREIIRQVTSAVSGYNPEYTTTDYAVRYIRAKNNIKITNFVEDLSSYKISYGGSNDMNTKCYFFSETDGQITFRFIELPQINGNNIVSVLK